MYAPITVDIYIYIYIYYMLGDEGRHVGIIPLLDH